MTEDPARALLALCARPTVPADLWPEIRRQATRIDDWNALPALAEQHGLAPLIYAHGTARAFPLPPDVRQQLLGLYVRHRHAATARLEALAEILRTFEEHEIESRVLKGMALAGVVYEDPALRPMSDIDLLVAPADVFRAQRLVRDLGFHAPVERPDRLRRHHHLAPAVRRLGGVSVLVELHHDVFPLDTGLSLQLGRISESPTVVRLDGFQALALGPHEMLWHLCHHLTRLWTPIRLVWVADVLGYTERFIGRLDWDRIRRQYPSVVGVLEALDVWTPLDPAVREAAHLFPLARVTQIGQDYAGWPRARGRVPGASASRVDYWRCTFNPPDWWLLLRHGPGLASGTRRMRAARLKHMAALVAAVRWYLRKAALILAGGGRRSASPTGR